MGENEEEEATGIRRTVKTRASKRGRARVSSSPNG